MKTRTAIIAVVVILAFLTLCAFMLGAVAYVISGDESIASIGSGKLGVVSIEGVIETSKTAIDDIRQFEKDDAIQAVVVRIDSPGGAVGASQEIYEALLELSKKKPTIATMGTVAASGGYYVALGASKIFANPGTTTGSIGVRLEHLNMGDLMKWAKLEHETLKSGALKDLLPFDRPISPEARKILQAHLEEIHAQFKRAVAERRNLEVQKVDELADGRIFTGESAKGLGLVDEVGGFTAAVNDAAKAAGIEGMPKLVKPRRYHRLVDRLIEEARGLIKSASMADYIEPAFIMGAEFAGERRQ